MAGKATVAYMKMKAPHASLYASGKEYKQLFDSLKKHAQTGSGNSTSLLMSYLERPGRVPGGIFKHLLPGRRNGIYIAEAEWNVRTARLF